MAVNAPTYETKQFGDMSILDVSASYDVETGHNVVFVVNRNQTDSNVVDIQWQDRMPEKISAVHQMSGTDPKAFNSFENPNQIVPISVIPPEVKDGCVTMKLPPLSFTVLELEV